MFRSMFVLTLLCIITFGLPNTTWADRCQTLNLRVSKVQIIRTRLVTAWKRCVQQAKGQTTRCRDYRTQALRWTGQLRTHRKQYDRWRCQFAWGGTSNRSTAPTAHTTPPSNPTPTALPQRYSSPQCRSLANKVTRAQQIRHRLALAWRKCGRTKPLSSRCMTYRDKARSWSLQLRKEKQNYKRLQCRFSWKQNHASSHSPTAPSASPTSPQPPHKTTPRIAQPRLGQNTPPRHCNATPAQRKAWQAAGKRFLKAWRTCAKNEGVRAPRCVEYRKKILHWRKRIQQRTGCTP